MTFLGSLAQQVVIDNRSICMLVDRTVGQKSYAQCYYNDSANKPPESPELRLPGTAFR